MAQPLRVSGAVRWPRVHWRGLAIRVAAVGVGVLVALALVEALLRLLALSPANGVVTVTDAEFRSLPGLLSPGQDLIDRRDARLPHHVTTNGLGYRGADLPLRKEPGEFRVLFTGDSFAYGDFVDDELTLPALLEQRLRGWCGNVRVVNAGVDNFTIVDEARMIDRGLVVDPDLVLVQFSENDVADLDRISSWDHLARNRRDKSRFPLSVAYPILRRTALWNFLLKVVAASRDRAQPRPTNGFAASGEDTTTHRLREAYRRALLAVRDSLAPRHIPLVLVIYPSHFNVTESQKRGQIEWLAKTAAAAGVPAVNLLVPLVASGLSARTLYLLPYDGHPSARGYGIAAPYLAEQLATLAPLRGRCGGSAARKDLN